MKRQTRSKNTCKRLLYEHLKNKRALLFRTAEVADCKKGLIDQRYRRGGIPDPTGMIVARIDSDPAIRELRQLCKPVDLLVEWVRTQPERKEYANILVKVYLRKDNVFLRQAAEEIGLDINIARKLHGNLLNKLSEFIQ